MTATQFPPIICTVDVALLTVDEGVLKIALHKRAAGPFEGEWALPGSFIRDTDATAKEAAIRTLADKLGVVSPYLEQLATFSGATRDPRGWSISVIYYALVAPTVLASAGTSTKWVSVEEALEAGLPFDHQDILECALTRIRNKSSYSSLPVFLMPSKFTLPQLQSVYEVVIGEPINKVTFRRKMEELNAVEPIEGAFEEGKTNRPAQYYAVRNEFYRELSVTNRGITA